VSKHDTHFFNTFSMVMGLLVTVTIILFALARVVAGKTQVPEVYSDKLYVAGVNERIKPLVRVAIAGKDNSALVIKGLASATEIKLVIPKDGAELYDTVCKTCHATGLSGAPKTGDRNAWAARIAQGKPTLYAHALAGYTGKDGAMPKKGGRTDLDDDLIKLGVDYLVAQAAKVK
jgi:cytochrome c5